MALYIPQHFSIKEYVPPAVYAVRGARSIELMDARLLRMDDLLRERYGPITINNWAWDGQRKESGLRSWRHYLPDGADYFNPSEDEVFIAMLRCDKSFSQHKYGRASDKLFRDVSVEEVRQDIIEKPYLFEEIASLELDVSWLHTDCRNCNHLKTYTP